MCFDGFNVSLGTILAQIHPDHDRNSGCIQKFCEFVFLVNGHIERCAPETAVIQESCQPFIGNRYDRVGVPTPLAPNRPRQRHPP